MRLFFLLLFIYANFSWASEVPKDLSTELKLKTTLYQSAIQTQLYLTNQVKPLILKSLTQVDYTSQKINEDVDELLSKIEFTDEYKKNPLVRARIKGFFLEMLGEVRVLARKDGIGLALLVGVNETIGNLSPFILTAIGLPQLIVPANLILTSEINVPITLALKKAFHRIKLVKLYGGRENFLKLRNLRKELDKDFGLDEDTVIYDADPETYYSIDTDFNFFDKILTTFKLTRVINPLSLKMALKRAGLWNEDLLKIKRSDIDSGLKSVLMISYVRKNFENGAEVIAERFPNSIHQRFEATIRPDVFEWGMKMHQIMDMDSLLTWADEVPDDTSSLEAILIWKHVVLPHLMENKLSGIRYRRYRHWVKGLDSFFARSELNPTMPWSQLRDEFRVYLADEN